MCVRGVPRGADDQLDGKKGYLCQYRRGRNNLISRQLGNSLYKLSRDMVAKNARKIIRAKKVGRAGGVDKRNRAGSGGGGGGDGGRATWNRESEGEGMLPLLLSLPLLPAGETDRIR